jgi:energy-coupling factor transport system ATP-binding protein
VPFADRIALLSGTSVLVGPPESVLEDSPVVPPIVELGRALAWSPLPLSVRDARRRASSLSLPPPVVRTPPPAPPGVSVSRLTVTHGRTVAVRELTLSVPAGRVTALMGRNGAGKSSLLWALHGSRPRTSGRVSVAGQDPASLTPARRRELIGLLPQTASDLLYLETVDEECAAGGPLTRSILDSLVLASRPPVVLLDEPTRGLDYGAKRALAASLRALADEGRTVLVSTHDVEFVALCADEVAVMAEGEVVSSGPVRQVVAESPAFAPQVTKVLGPPWLRVDEVTS